MRHEKQSFLRIKQQKREFILTKLKASALVKISYASMRGQDDEEGAVQRILNPRRIAGIRDFTLAGGDYASCIILNWVDQKNPLKESGATVSVPVVPRCAQIIDGQHRVEGLREAIKSDAKVGLIDIPVAIYRFLDTRACADIFLSINTEQKPVLRSLVFDLYGIASEAIVDPASVRARDIALRLTEDQDSPYIGLIRFPGAAKGQRGVDLSTVVVAIKPLVEDKGMFETVGLKELEVQTRVLFNYLRVLREWYADRWNQKDNAFLSAAGFSGAMAFLKNKLIPYCNANRTFTFEFIRGAMRLSSSTLVRRGDLKGLQGRAAIRRVTEVLEDMFNPAVPDEQAIQV